MKLQLLIILLLFPICVSAHKINFLQDSYKPGETLQAEILIPNSASEINFKNIIIFNLTDEIKLGFILEKITNEYYFLYFNLPDDIQDDSYTLEVKDILYKENNILKEAQISNNFTVNSQISRDLFTIQPAILQFEKNTPYKQILIQNKEQKSITLQINSSDKIIQTLESQLIIPANSQKTINIYLTKITKGAKEYVYIGNYKIPVWILGGISVASIQGKTFSFAILEENNEVLLERLDAELSENQISYENIIIQNLLNESVYNLSISLTGNLNEIIELNTTFADEIKPNDKIIEYILINKERAPKSESYLGNLVLSSEKYNIEFPIELNILKEEIPIEEIPEEAEPVKLVNETKIPEKQKIEEKSPVTFILAIVSIILLLIIVYFIIPKKKT